MHDHFKTQLVTVDYNVSKCGLWLGPKWEQRVDTLYGMTHWLRSALDMPEHATLNDRVAVFCATVADIHGVIRVNKVSAWATQEHSDPITLLVDRVKDLRAFCRRNFTADTLREALGNAPARIKPIDPEDCRFWPLVALDDYFEAMKPSFYELIRQHEAPAKPR